MTQQERIQQFAMMSANQKRRSFGSWKKRKLRVIIRDGAQCKMCGTKDRLEVHHILSRAEFPHFANEKQNLITLCRHCHDKADSGNIKVETLFNLI